MKQVTSAGIVVYREHNNQREYLLLHYASGHWDFAKGHLEAGETIEQAAHRELFEEAGITAQVHDGFKHSFAYTLTGRDGMPELKTVYFFAGKALSDNIRLSHEHKDFMWLPYADAIKKLTYDNARNLLYNVHHFLNAR